MSGVCATLEHWYYARRVPRFLVVVSTSLPSKSSTVCLVSTMNTSASLLSVDESELMKYAWCTAVLEGHINPDGAMIGVQPIPTFVSVEAFGAARHGTS